MSKHTERAPSPIPGLPASVEEFVQDARRRLVLIQAAATVFSFEGGEEVVDAEDVMDAIRWGADDVIRRLDPILECDAKVLNAPVGKGGAR